MFAASRSRKGRRQLGPQLKQKAGLVAVLMLLLFAVQFVRQL
jgi:hypothetical protein